MTPACAGLFEPRRSGLELLKSTLNAKNFMRRCRDLSLAISLQFSVEMCAASKNCEKFTKNLFLRDSSRSRSLMLVNSKSLSPVLVMISSMYVPICNRFHIIRANNGKITSFRGYPSLTPSLEGNPHSLKHKILSR